MPYFGDTRLPTRFWNKVHTEPNSGCWLWTGYSDPAGYGRITIASVAERTHRLTFSTLVAAIPAGTEIDHLCRTRECCNPAHLEPVTHHENVLRGDSHAARQHRRTRCIRGHVFDRIRVHHVTGNPTRLCLVCRRERARLERETRKAG